MKRRAEGKNFFLDNLQHELVAMKEDIEDFGSDLRSNIVGGVKGIGAVVTGQTGDRDREREKEKERKKEKEERRAARRSEVEDLEGAFGESGGGLSALKERRRGVPLDEGQLPGRPTRGDSRVSASQRSRSRTSSAGVSMGGAVGYSGEEPHHQTSSETDQHSTTRTGNRGEGGRSSGSGGNKDATTHNPMLDLI